MQSLAGVGFRLYQTRGSLGVCDQADKLISAIILLFHCGAKPKIKPRDHFLMPLMRIMQRFYKRRNTRKAGTYCLPGVFIFPDNLLQGTIGIRKA